jgi:hypothetical protein
MSLSTAVPVPAGPEAFSVVVAGGATAIVTPEGSRPTRNNSMMYVTVAEPIMNTFVHSAPPLFLNFNNSDVAPIMEDLENAMPRTQRDVEEYHRCQVLLQVYHISRFVRVVCVLQIAFLILFGVSS